MGVEYQHFIIPKDPDFVYAPATVDQLQNQLKKIGAWAEDDRLVTIDSKGQQSPAGKNGWRFSRGRNQGTHIAKLIGPSYYDEVDDANRYIKITYIVFGPSYKIHDGNDNIYVETKGVEEIDINTMVRPSIHAPIYRMTSTRLTTGHCSLDLRHVDMTDRHWFTGYWKSAVIIDLGKCLPKWADQMIMPNPQIRQTVEEVTGEKHGEIGNYY